MNYLTFWGVQGSCPGNFTENSLGNNTPCLSIQLDKTLLIFDAGTGIRQLSTHLKPEQFDRIILFLTHSHWDHIQGFPFFNFLHQHCTIHVYCPNKTHTNYLINQINGINFPLNKEDLIAKLIVEDSLDDIMKLLNITINTIKTNHHGDCYGYRVKSDTIDVCYIPDNQLHNPTTSSFEAFKSFCNESNILIHDAQYTENDMPNKENWGHSMYKDVVLLAKESKTKKLIFFHHDPERTKTEINQIVQRFQSENTQLEITAAYEQLKIDLLGNL